MSSSSAGSSERPRSTPAARRPLNSENSRDVKMLEDTTGSSEALLFPERAVEQRADAGGREPGAAAFGHRLAELFEEAALDVPPRDAPAPAGAVEDAPLGELGEGAAHVGGADAEAGGERAQARQLAAGREMAQGDHGLEVRGHLAVDRKIVAKLKARDVDPRDWHGAFPQMRPNLTTP